MSQQYKARHAVRALLYAEDTRSVLLIRTLIPDSGKEIWLAPGGGMEADETPHEALFREIHEETGITINQATGPVWYRQQKFHLHGQAYDQYEDFYWVPTQEFEPDNTLNPALSEKDIFRGFHWWSLAEMQAATSEIFVPLTFANHLADILDSGVPDLAVDVGR